jgi:addiction module HigA family antidote
MADDLVTKRPDRPPTHPGAVLREDVFPALGVKVMTAARELGISRQTLHRILAEDAPVTPAMAVRLGKFCGNGPELWLNMQGRYDLWHAERALRQALERIPTRAA